MADGGEGRAKVMGSGCLRSSIHVMTVTLGYRKQDTKLVEKKSSVLDPLKPVRHSR